MTLADAFLICFLVGLALTVVFALAGTTHLHLPHVHFDHGVPHVHAPPVHGSQGSGQARPTGVAPINMGTVTAFFAWFGGAGYLTRHYGLPLWIGLLVAVAVGLIGAALVFWFVSTVLVSHDENLDPADYEMVGVFGRLTSSIRAGETGELVYSQQGTRRTVVARSDDGNPIAKGAEVIVTRYERGIAYVRSWDSATAPLSASNSRVDH